MQHTSVLCLFAGGRPAANFEWWKKKNTRGFGVGKRHEELAVVFGANLQNVLQQRRARVHFRLRALHDHLRQRQVRDARRTEKTERGQRPAAANGTCKLNQAKWFIVGVFV